MPRDADAYKDGIVVYNKCSDLAALVSLHIEYGTAEQEEKAEAAVTETLRLLSEWETELSEEDCAFPTERLAPFLEPMGKQQEPLLAILFLESAHWRGMLWTPSPGDMDRIEPRRRI